MDTASEGPVALLALAPRSALEDARRLVLAHDLGTLDAIHLAVADRLRSEEGEEVAFCSRDAHQVRVAQAMGFPLR